MVQHSSLDHTGITGIISSYGSNANSIAALSAGGASTAVSRADHVHVGVTSIAHSSNTFSGPITLVAQGSIGITRTDASTIAINAVAGSGSGSASSLTHTYVGYNTAGGSSATVTAHMIYMKQITLSANGQLESVSAYIKQNTAATLTPMAVGVWTDNGGAPQFAVAGGYTQFFIQHVSGTPGTARWVAVPVGVYLTAGTYWIGVQIGVATTLLYYDGSGSDRTNAANSTPQLADYGNIYTVATTVNKYSIRASVLS